MNDVIDHAMLRDHVTSQPRDALAGGHLVAFGGRWKLWRSFVLRSAGLPFELLAGLSVAATDGALGTLFDCETSERSAFAALETSLQRLLRSAKPSDRPSVWSMASRKLRRGNLAGARLIPELAEKVAAVEAARDRRETAYLAFKRDFEKRLEEADIALADAGGVSRFREAVAWQNLNALRNAVDLFSRPATSARPLKFRKKAEIIAKYLQRYCAKNDSIGFFGPVAWGEIVESGTKFMAHPGKSLVSGQDVQFEYWAMDAFAAHLGNDKELRPFLHPVLSPTARIEDGRVFGPFGRRYDLPAAIVRMLTACDGRTPAHRIAGEAAIRDTHEIATEADGLDALERLSAAGMIDWSIRLPVTWNPQSALRSILERLDAGEACRRGIAALDRLDECRTALLRASGDPDAVAGAYARLEETFEGLAGGSAHRAPGRTYAGRSVAFVDCTRDVDVSIGAGLMREIAPALSIALDSARWYTWQFAVQLNEFCVSMHAGLVAANGTSDVPLDVFMTEVSAQQDVMEAIAGDVSAQLAEIWDSVLADAGDTRDLRLDSESLRAGLRGRLDAPDSGWFRARYQAPDLMIAAESIDAINSGRYSAVLGELHVATNSVLATHFCALHPKPEDIFHALERDIPEPQLVAVADRNREGLRATFDSFSRSDFHVAFNETPSWRPDHQVLNVGSLVVYRSGDRLQVGTRDRAHSFDLIRSFSAFFREIVLSGFELLPRRRHMPRITIDNLVVSRETWRLPAAKLSFRGEPETIDRYIALARVARRLGLPRHLFLRIHCERKPVYVDTSSPVLVDMMIKFIRQAEADDPDAEVSISEMLPGPDALWLADADGKRYTSELRVIAVDSEGRTGGAEGRNR